jgi:hypothetical protein
MIMGFRRCSNCGVEWLARDRFLSDPDISLVGYQVHFDRLMEGLFLFNHTCKTTLSLPAALFRNLYHGPVFSDRMTGTEACPGHCLHNDSLDPCPAQCECAFVREILQMIANWPKIPR